MKSESSRGRILVADDDDAFCVATRSFLRAEGYACETARDAAGARDWLAREAFDLLIADLNMPGNAGLELVQAVADQCPGLPVVILTGQPTLQSAAQSVRLPVVGYLMKPPNPDELLTVASQAVTQHQVHRAIRASRDRLESWVRELARLEDLSNRPGRAANPDATENYLNLTLANLFAGLAELRQLTEAISRSESQRGLLQSMALYKALRETVDVLEKTKQAFRSKELGELRRKLEGLLHEPPPNAGGEPPGQSLGI